MAKHLPLFQFYREQMRNEQKHKVLKGDEFSLGDTDLVSVEGTRKTVITPKRLTRLGMKIMKAVQVWATVSHNTPIK